MKQIVILFASVCMVEICYPIAIIGILTSLAITLTEIAKEEKLNGK